MTSRRYYKSSLPCMKKYKEDYCKNDQTHINSISQCSWCYEWKLFRPFCLSGHCSYCFSYACCHYNGHYGVRKSRHFPKTLCCMSHHACYFEPYFPSFPSFNNYMGSSTSKYLRKPTKVSSDLYLEDNAQETHIKDLENLCEGSKVNSDRLLYTLPPTVVDDIHSPGQEESFFNGVHSTKPIGFLNPPGSHFLSCIIQILRGCTDFNNAILNFANTKEMKSNDKTIMFFREFCNLLKALEDNSTHLIESSLDSIQDHFRDISESNDVHKFYLNLLNELQKSVERVDTSSPRFVLDERLHCTDDHFVTSKLEKKGLIFDLFFGQINIRSKCPRCSKILQDQYCLLKSILLLVPTQGGIPSLKKCIESYLSESQEKDLEGKECDCSKEDKEYITEIIIIDAPRYLMLYFNRDLLQDDDITNRFVSTDEEMTIEASSGSVKYKLISVMDHVKDQDRDQYYCKCNYEGEHWWSINDTQVTDTDEIVTKNTIVWMYKQI